jgi:hypothetical protein
LVALICDGDLLAISALIIQTIRLLATSMNYIDVEIVRITAPDCPVWVECVLRDANEREWFFTDKSPVFTAGPIHERMPFPQPGVLACELVREWIDEQGRSRCLIDTEKPWDVEARDGETRFEVFKEQLRWKPHRTDAATGTF